MQFMIKTSTNPSYRLTGIKTSVPHSGCSTGGDQLGLSYVYKRLFSRVELGLISHSPAELLGLDGPASPPACACSGAGDPWLGVPPDARFCPYNGSN